ncbi:type IV secretion system protein [Cupriavidus necator]
MAKPFFTPLRPLLASCLAALTIGPAQAQWTVIDPSNLAQNILAVEQMKQQVQTMERQYTAITGNRGYGQILNAPALRSYLPDQWQTVYDQVRTGQLPGITSAAQAVINAEGLGGTTAGDQRYNATLATNKAMATQAYNATLTRLTNIQALMKQANLTEDSAAKADLQNRIAAENAMIQNEQTRLNLMTNLQQVEEKLAGRQREIDFKNRLLGNAR